MFPTLASTNDRKASKVSRISSTSTLGPRMGWIPLLFLACCCCTTVLGHLGSLAEGPYPPSFGCCAGYARLSHPRLGEIKSPVLPYSRRVARDPFQNTQYYDGGDENSRYTNFRPPSFQHKFPQARLSKFYHSTGRDGNSGSGRGQQPLPLLANSKTGVANGQQHPTLKELLHSLHNPELEASAEQPGAGLDNDEQPTFTPYIGARALSNMKEFFEHLQDNIEALRKDEGEQEEVGGGSSENGGNSEHNYDARALASTANFRSEWKPHALGDHGLKKIRSFLPFINQETTRSRLGTNLGLGRRRR